MHGLNASRGTDKLRTVSRGDSDRLAGVQQMTTKRSACVLMAGWRHQVYSASSKKHWGLLGREKTLCSWLLASRLKQIWQQNKIPWGKASSYPGYQLVSASPAPFCVVWCDGGNCQTIHLSWWAIRVYCLLRRVLDCWLQTKGERWGYWRETEESL